MNEWLAFGVIAYVWTGVGLYLETRDTAESLLRELVERGEREGHNFDTNAFIKCARAVLERGG